MSVTRTKSQKGSATAEFALVFMPLTLMFLGIIEVARIGWMHQTLAMGVKTIARQSIVRGERCLETDTNCGKTIANWVETLRTNVVGIDPQKLSLTFSGASQTKSCAPAVSCLSDATIWPPVSENTVGLPITIRGTYELTPFYWIMGNKVNGSWTLAASARDVIQF